MAAADTNVRPGRQAPAANARGARRSRLARLLLQSLELLQLDRKLLLLLASSLMPACIIPIGPDWQDPPGERNRRPTLSRSRRARGLAHGHARNHFQRDGGRREPQRHALMSGGYSNFPTTLSPIFSDEKPPLSPSGIRRFACPLSYPVDMWTDEDQTITTHQITVAISDQPWVRVPSPGERRHPCRGRNVAGDHQLDLGANVSGSSHENGSCDVAHPRDGRVVHGRRRSQAPSTGGAGSSGNYPRCSMDAQCGSMRLCVEGTCLPPPGASALPWAVEIQPFSPSQAAMLTEKMMEPGGNSWALQADRALELGATFDADAANASTITFPSSANALLEISSLIPGRPPLTFEGAVRVSDKTATITVPEGIQSRSGTPSLSGTLRLIPLAPADQSSPPYRFSALIPATGSVLRDAAAPTMTTFRLAPYNRPSGVLVDALGAPKVGHTARAFLGGTLVSSAAVTQTDGRFVLLIPGTVTEEVNVQIAPASSGYDPWYIFNKRALADDLGTVKLPAYQVPNPDRDPPFVFKVQGPAASAEPVAGATVRATTILSAPPTDPVGTTRFWRTAMTTSEGRAEMFLIPGANNTTRAYTVDVVPPAGTAYAATCQTKQLLAGGEVVTVELPRRPVLSGTVMSALGGVVSGVTVVATRDPGSPNDCSLSPPTTVSVVTGADGSFQLPLDPGTYQLDYDPPAGSSSPRMTEFEVAVDADVVRPVLLAAPAIIEGDVQDAVGMPLPNATVRIYQPRCDTQGCKTPFLRAKTQTDLGGHFRAVVEDPAAN